MKENRWTFKRSNQVGPPVKMSGFQINNSSINYMKVKSDRREQLQQIYRVTKERLILLPLRDFQSSSIV